MSDQGSPGVVRSSTREIDAGGGVPIAVVGLLRVRARSERPARRHSRHWCETLIRLAGDVIYHGRFRPDGEPLGFELGNPDQVRAVLGCAADAVPVTPEDLLAFVHDDDRAQRLEEVRTWIASGEGRRTATYRVRNRRTREVRWLEDSMVLHRAGDEVVLYGVARDVTDRREMQERLEYLRFHDALTGLPNRAKLLQEYELQTGPSGRSEPHVGLLYVNIDRLGDVNDSFGHAAGDAVIVDWARRLTQLAGPGSVVARVAGDEFAVLMPPPLDESRLARTASQIGESVVRSNLTQGPPVTTTANVGAVSGPRNSRTGEELVRDGNVAVSHAKLARQQRVVSFAPAMREAALARLDLRTALNQAVEGREFEVHYQPILDVATWRIEAVEALLRWRRADGSVVPPSAFIPFAEETGLIGPIGRWVLGEAVRQLAEWSGRYPSPPRMNVNVSARQLEDAGFVDELADLLASHDVAPSRLTIEVTESSATGEQHEAALRRVRDLGVAVSIDDFGTGYSDLLSLSSLDVDELKIDRAFVDGVDGRVRESAVARAVIDLAKTFGLRVVAEGVERPEQVRRLRDLGCDYVQGFLFSRPEPARALEPLFAAGHARSAGHREF